MPQPRAFLGFHIDERRQHHRSPDREQIQGTVLRAAGWLRLRRRSSQQQSTSQNKVADNFTVDAQVKGASARIVDELLHNLKAEEQPA